MPRLSRALSAAVLAVAVLVPAGASAQVPLPPGEPTADSETAPLGVLTTRFEDPGVVALSTRADLVSGGDVLVELVGPLGDDWTVALDGADVTDAFAPRDAYDGRVLGLVEGVRRDGSELVLTTDSGTATLELEDHPLAGPVFSGPQIQPWACADGTRSTAERPRDCADEPSFELLYMPAAPGLGFQPYDDSVPDGAVATTTTDEGVEVPFIVRQETGVLNRDEYRIAVLFQPDEPWTAVEPQEQFNHKLVLTHGASCDTDYGMAEAPDVLLEDALGRGFAVASHALDNAGHNCNLLTQAEALVMTKELLADRYGALRYTIGSGCSGGALVQQQVANAYPGVYQGISPQCSFADAWSTAAQYVDYVLLLDYFRGGDVADVAPLWAAPDREGDTDYLTAAGRLFGHPNLANPVTFTEVIPNSGEPTRECVPEDEVYDEDSNPDGVRCTLQDYMVNVFGRRAADGFANRPYDNVGVQYGLSGLQNGTIAFDAFLDVNRDVGGFDIDLSPVDERSRGDVEGIRQMYLSGASNTATHLDQVAIIDLRGPDPGAFHDAYRTSVLEERLLREHGHADNHVRWEGSVPLLGDVNYVDEAIVALDAWLAEVEADTRDVPLADKVVDARAAAGVEPRCSDGLFAQDVPQAYCDTVVDEYSSPRIEAGMPLTDDVAKCRLVPVREFDYGAFEPDDEQLAALEELFADGVCDYTRPGVEQQATVPWRTYEDGPGTGRPLGPTPTSTFVSSPGSSGQAPGAGGGTGDGTAVSGAPSGGASGGASGVGSAPSAAPAGAALPATGGGAVPAALAVLALAGVLRPGGWRAAARRGRDA